MSMDVNIRGRWGRELFVVCGAASGVKVYVAVFCAPALSRFSHMGPNPHERLTPLVMSYCPPQSTVWRRLWQSDVRR